MRYFWASDILGRKFSSRAEEPFWELIPTEPVVKVVEFRPADCQKNIFLAHQVLLSSRSKLSPEKYRIVPARRVFEDEGITVTRI